MPFFLTVPPAAFISENPEASLVLNAASQEYVQARVNELVGSQAKPSKEIFVGAMRGTRVYTWNKDYSAILYSAFLLPSGLSQKREILRVSSLVRQNECIHLGSHWESPAGMDALTRPEGLPVSGPSLSAALARTPRTLSTIRFDSAFSGAMGERARVLFDIYGGEVLASQGLPVNSSVSRLACKWAVEKNVDGSVKVTEYPARAHRLVVARFTLEPGDAYTVPQDSKLSVSAKGTSKAPQAAPPALFWPKLQKGSVTLNSGVFGDKTKTLIEIKEPTAFLPDRLLSTLMPALTLASHDVKQEGFKVIKRLGRWIFLDRGRAYGLEIGTHLVGPKGSTLHVIQFAPGEGNADAAVALLRTEDQQSPVREGDAIVFDPTVFPVRK